jgi:hypothetical protein
MAYRKRPDIIGMKFGRLTVIEMAERERDESGKLKPVQYVCQCDCGNKAVVRKDYLTKGATKSCGCLRNEIIKNPRPKKTMCPYPSYSCGKTICCFECEEQGECEEVCLNRPERCGAK